MENNQNIQCGQKPTQMISLVQALKFYGAVA